MQKVRATTGLKSHDGESIKPGDLIKLTCNDERDNHTGMYIYHECLFDEDISTVTPQGYTIVYLGDHNKMSHISLLPPEESAFKIVKLS